MKETEQPKKQEASQEKRVRKLKMTPTWAEYGERNAKREQEKT